MRIFGLVGLATAGMFAGALAISPANSASITYDLTSDHCTGGCLGGLTSLGTVTVTEIGGGGLSFSVDLTSSNSGIVHTGFDGSFAFDLNGNPTITYSAITATAALPLVRWVAPRLVRKTSTSSMVSGALNTRFCGTSREAAHCNQPVVQY